jgi:hypothetical protein
VKGKRVGLELEAATVRHYTGFRVFTISVLVIRDGRNGIRGTIAGVYGNEDIFATSKGHVCQFSVNEQW